MILPKKKDNHNCESMQIPIQLHMCDPSKDRSLTSSQGYPRRQPTLLNRDKDDVYDFFIIIIASIPPALLSLEAIPVESITVEVLCVLL